MNVTPSSSRSGRRRTGRHRSVFLTVAVVAAGIGGYTAASASSGDGNPSRSEARTSAADQRLIAPGALPGGQTETYTGITPCRIVDTRAAGAGGPITSAATRTFAANGNLSAQGGASNCGIPNNASSIAVNLTAITTGGTGFIRAGAYGSAPPAATLLNYAPGLNPTNQVNIPLCRQTTADPYRCLNGDFTVKNFGSAHLVADAVGYYTPPLFAVVSGAGVVEKSSGVHSVTRTTGLPTGNFTIAFDRDVSACAASATDVNWNFHHDVSIELGSSLPNLGEVAITKADGSYRNSSFYVTVTC